VKLAASGNRVILRCTSAETIRIAACRGGGGEEEGGEEEGEGEEGGVGRRGRERTTSGRATHKRAVGGERSKSEEVRVPLQMPNWAHGGGVV
jgi:hypothetical protein